jgi:hypothetical protein
MTSLYSLTNMIGHNDVSVSFDLTRMSSSHAVSLDTISKALATRSWCDCDGDDEA